MANKEQIKHEPLYHYYPLHGRTTAWLDCPYCGYPVQVYIWSLCGSGKKCPKCGVIHHREYSINNPQKSTKEEKDEIKRVNNNDLYKLISNLIICGFRGSAQSIANIHIENYKKEK